MGWMSVSIFEGCGSGRPNPVTREKQGTGYYELIDPTALRCRPTNNFRLVSLGIPFLHPSSTLRSSRSRLIPSPHGYLLLCTMHYFSQTFNYECVLVPRPCLSLDSNAHSRCFSVTHGRMSSSECGISIRIPIVLTSWPWMSSTALWTPPRASSGQSGCLAASKDPLHGS